jgi:hypothetical protein
MAADHSARGLRERNHTGRALEQFETARDLRLLDGQAIGRERGIGFRAQFVADVVQPGFEAGGTVTALGAVLEVRMCIARSPQAREFGIVKMAAAETVKK